LKPDFLGRLDALAGKRRSFVAGSAGAGDSAKGDDDDLPMLTEVVDITEVSGDQPNSLSHGLSEPLLESMAAELANAVQQRVTADFPMLLEEATQRLSLELRRGIHQITEAAIRDYMARRRQLSLPLDDTVEDKAP
jgi:iron-sulfur cluster repair protein YtfE (RIC family)